MIILIIFFNAIVLVALSYSLLLALRLHREVREVRALRASLAALRDPPPAGLEIHVHGDGATLTPAFSRALGEMAVEDLRRAHARGGEPS